MKGRALLLGGLIVMVGLLALPQGQSEAAPAARGRVDGRVEKTFRMDDGSSARAVMTAQDEIFLEAQPLAGEGLLAFCRRLCGTDRVANEILRLNGIGKRLLAGRWYRISLDLLPAAHRSQVLAALFPADQAHPGGWRHEVRRFDGLPEDSLWRIAQRFTGSGQRYRDLRLHNELPDNSIYSGQTLWIPSSLLRQPLRELLPSESRPMADSADEETIAPAVRSPAAEPIQPAEPLPAATIPLVPPTPPGPLQEPYYLEYGKDAQGEYAIYHLKPGEALYSSVVVRFTGRIYANDVNALAADIARRNGVLDVTDMRIGFPVKIPLDLLQPEFLPPGHPLRRDYDETQRASAQFSNTVQSRDLAGITVILDAGHGGRDVGATRHGVWESVYVYDIMLRLRQLLLDQTAAEVHTTTRDGDHYRIVDRDVLPFAQEHAVLTSPPYSLKEDSRVGVNLRWYLANSLLRKAESRGRKLEDVVFLSLHADSLHPTLRGAMVYIPDAYLRQGSFQKTGTVYSSRLEVRENPRVSYSWAHRIKSQGLSRQLADHVIASFRRTSLGVHQDKPVRQKIYRGRNPWVPAVLRYNAVPAALLIEVCNLNNDQDRALLQTRAFRQRAAAAIVDGLRAYYDQPETAEPQVARSAK